MRKVRNSGRNSEEDCSLAHLGSGWALGYLPREWCPIGSQDSLLAYPQARLIWAASQVTVGSVKLLELPSVPIPPSRLVNLAKQPMGLGISLRDRILQFLYAVCGIFGCVRLYACTHNSSG